MICMRCQLDLANCICPDLRERLEAIVSSPFIYLDPGYIERIIEQAERNEQESSGSV